MRTSINGLEADWTPDIQAKWEAARDESAPDAAEVVQANYFTPRPWRNEYDRGSPDEGFTYTVGRYPAQPSVWKVVINRDEEGSK